MNIPVVKFEGPYPVYRFDRKHGRMILIEEIPWLPIWRVWHRGLGWLTTY